MRIQHNLPAVNAHRRLGINSGSTHKNLEKLSSGFRINRAGDDAAGLAISEKMRGQIRGLGMAEQNAGHGIDLIQTAEGGMNEICAILHRQRELAVQASNGTYQDEDRAQLQKEMSALTGEINRTAESTHYNGIKLLDGSTQHVGPANLFNLFVEPHHSLLVGYIDVVAGESFWVSFTDLDDNGSSWPDINLFDPNGLEYGYDADYMGGDTATTLTKAEIEICGDIAAFDSITYTGSITTDNNEKFTITGVTAAGAGRWEVWVKNTQGDQQGTVALQSDKLIKPAANLAANITQMADLVTIPIQVGANNDEVVRVNLYDCRTDTLGIENLSVATVEDANAAIDLIDDALQIVAGYRATCGAQQNRLEHTLNNLGVTKENLTDAESTIRDVDMAKEMMAFTANNILIQSAQAMLAQANQLPQGVLSMLR